MDGRPDKRTDGRTERQKLSPSAFLPKSGGQKKPTPCPSRHVFFFFENTVDADLLASDKAI